MTRVAPTESDATRFWAMVDKTETCWNWTGYVRPNGYGMFGIRHAGGRRTEYVHRLAYQLERSAIEPGAQIDHICHNRSCVRPDHLRPVTHKENQENRSGATSRSKSGVRGVSWDGKKWRASVYHAGKSVNAGTFDSIEDAASAVVAKRNELFTHNLLDRIPA